MFIILFLVGHWYSSLFCQTFFLHRYASHGQVVMKRFWRKFFHICTFIFQGASYLSPRAYAVLHRMHHAFSDTENDPHSPHFSENPFVMMYKTKEIYQGLYERKILPDERFEKNIPEWDTLDKIGDNWFARGAWMVLYTIIYIIAISVFQLPGTHWAMYALLPIHFVIGPLQGAIVNWCGHKYGYANYDNQDHSKNTLFWDVFLMGELFQNNHHKWPSRSNFATRWFEFDPLYPLLWVFDKLGIAKIKNKPKKVAVERVISHR
jgi:stearoyl-CoA desaturase (Delta-9 desaturase)